MVTSPFAHPIRLAVAAVLSICAVSSCIAANAWPKENVNDIAYGVNDRLYYRSPAAIWEETLPLGNGRLGMMPDGGVYREHIVLNEISCGAVASPTIRILMRQRAFQKSADCFPKERMLRLRGLCMSIS